MRMTRESNFRKRAMLALATFMLTPVAVSNPQPANAFNSLLGSWTGSGELVLQGGQWESVKCNVYYTGGGSKLRVAVRCASSGYRVEVRSKLTRAGDRISGSWEERTYNAAGEVEGRIREDQLSFSIVGSGLSGSMTVSLGSSQQSVKLSTKGIRLKSVSMTLSRMGERSRH